MLIANEEEAYVLLLGPTLLPSTDQSAEDQRGGEDELQETDGTTDSQESGDSGPSGKLVPWTLIFRIGAHSLSSIA